MNGLIDATGRRDIGIADAEESQERASPGYSKALYDCIVQIATEQPTVHIDDVLLRFDRKPRHPNANAGPWRRAKNAGIIAPSGSARPCSVDVGKNAHVYPVYESRIYVAAA